MADNLSRNREVLQEAQLEGWYKGEETPTVLWTHANGTIQQWYKREGPRMSHRFAIIPLGRQRNRDG